MRKLLGIIGFVVCAGLFGAPVWGSERGPEGTVVMQDSVRLGYSVRGRVVDAETMKPLEAVHVSVPGRHHATVTNADGVFVLKSDREIREVVCSYLGYRSVRRKADGNSLSIRLQRENLPLSEASIISGDPRAIVEAAMDQVWFTYCTEPELLECFYRETIRKRNRYTYVAEAVSRLYKDKYDGSVYRDAAALEKSRVLVSQRAGDTLSVKCLGGPSQAISQDIVKNNEILFNKEDLALYTYQMDLPTYIDDRLQFVIKMEPAADVFYPLYHCTLYIDRELLTFTRIVASMDMSDKAKVTRAILVSRPIGLQFTPEEVELTLNYRLQDGKSRLQYFRSTMRFACDWRKRLLRTRYTTVNELVVTDVREEAVPIARKDRFRARDCLAEKAPEFQDPDFWQDYNIIEPSESLEHAIDRLKKGR